jgi:hypothetical protein
MNDDVYVYRIFHKPTRLFYCSRKGRFKGQITNLSAKGNFYESEKMVKKVFEIDCVRAEINDAQVFRSGCKVVNMYDRKYCRKEDFVIRKYVLKEVNQVECRV